MGGLLAGLASLAQPILARVLLALGMAAVTIVGVDASFGALKSLVLAQFAGFPVAVVQLGGLMGVWQGIGIVIGAATWCVTFYALTRSVRIAGA